MLLPVKLHELNSVNESEYSRVVCVCKYKDKWVFVKHKERTTWEIPGGHIEEGEDWLTAAKRELFEETGATKVEVKRICAYSISKYGLLCFAKIIELSDLPFSEIERIGLFEDIPDNLTYPAHKLFFDKVKEVKGL